MSTTSTPGITRDAAIARIKSRRTFQVNLAVYVAVNLVLVLIWVVTRGDGDPFWPIWPIAIWGVGVSARRGRGGRASPRCARRPRR